MSYGTTRRTAPHGGYVEIFADVTCDPMWFELVCEQPRIENGFMHVPQAPGLGIPLRADGVAVA